MKKVIFALILPAMTLTMLAGCSSSPEPAATAGTSKDVIAGDTTDEVDEAPKAINQFEGQQELGQGSFDIANVSGNTASGDDITVIYDPDTFPTDISIETKGIDGSKMSFIYVDGEFVAEEHLGYTTTSIWLQDTPVAIEEGVHTIQLVQYDTDDESGEIVTFKSQKYTLKNK